MSTITDRPAGLDPKALREQMTARLLAAGHITRHDVAEAFRTVPATISCSTASA